MSLQQPSWPGLTRPPIAPASAGEKRLCPRADARRMDGRLKGGHDGCWNNPLKSQGFVDEGCSCYVPILGLSSQNDLTRIHHHRLPARRAPRGGFARAAQTARSQGGGGYPPKLREQFYCQTRRRAARQPQRLEAWPLLRGDVREDGGGAPHLPQAAGHQRRNRCDAERRAESGRSHRPARSPRADSGRLARGRTGGVR